jgi:arylsulfatase
MAPAQNPPTDRTVLPLAEPNYPRIRELDVRKAPPLFQVKAPPGAPDVIVILLDNLGFGATKPFGGVINMPTLERVAKNGVITNFHTAPLCSPSRMALIGGPTMRRKSGAVEDRTKAVQDPVASSIVVLAS